MIRVTKLSSASELNEKFVSYKERQSLKSLKASVKHFYLVHKLSIPDPPPRVLGTTENAPGGLSYKSGGDARRVA